MAVLTPSYSVSCFVYFDDMCKYLVYGIGLEVDLITLSIIVSCTKFTVIPKCLDLSSSF